MESTVEQLLKAFKENLQSNNTIAVDPALMKLLDSLKTLPKESQKEYGEKIANMAYEKGLKAYKAFDIYLMPVLVNCIGRVYYRFPDNETIAYWFLDIDKGQLDLKLQIQENDNLEIYQEDIEDVAKEFPNNAKIALQCMECYALLQANYSMAAQTMDSFVPPLSFVEKNVDSMEAISARFPNDKSINLVYCRSLAATTSKLFQHPKREKYNKFIELLKNLVQTRKFDVPKDIIDFLKIV